MDKGAWRAKVHGVSKSHTQLSTHVLGKHHHHHQLKEDKSVFDLLYTQNIFLKKSYSTIF